MSNLAHELMADEEWALLSDAERIESGLWQSWAGQRVYCNPSYGRVIGRWIVKAMTEPVEELILLVPARRDSTARTRSPVGRGRVADAWCTCVAVQRRMWRVATGGWTGGWSAGRG